MILDTSAVIAILKNEPDAAELVAALGRSPIRRISAVSYVEAAIVTDSNRDPLLSRRLDDLLRDTRTTMEGVTVRQAEVARAAYRDFGKRRHKAGLNFGDCFAYALAKEMDEPLLCKGNDFRHTDLEIVKI